MESITVHRGNLQTIVIFPSGHDFNELIKTVSDQLGLPLGKLVWIEDTPQGYTLHYFDEIGDTSSVRLVPITRELAQELIDWVIKGKDELILQPTPF
jgi:hypothetical protein